MEFYTIVEATNGMEALDTLATQKIDILMTNASMPKIDGMEFFSKVRINYPKVSILGITNNSNINTQKDISSIIKKPFDSSELFKKINRLLTNPETNAFPRKDVHFLVIDDDEVDRQAIKRAFEKNKIANHIIDAENGLEAIKYLKSKNKEYFIINPVIILLDLNMPKMNGIEFLSELRNDPNLKRIIVFVMTTSDDEKDKMEAYNLNIAGYIIKGKLGESIINSISMIDAYWKIIEMPPY